MEKQEVIGEGGRKEKLEEKKRKKKILAVIRHCEYGDDGHLTKEGKENAGDIGKRLAEEIADMQKEYGELNALKIVILTSPIERARETGNIFFEVFNSMIPFKTLTLTIEPLLSEQYATIGKAKGLLEIIKNIVDQEEGNNAFILVTHKPNCRAISLLLGDMRAFFDSYGEYRIYDLNRINA